jgi:hypothetical protein
MLLSHLCVNYASSSDCAVLVPTPIFSLHSHHSLEHRPFIVCSCLWLALDSICLFIYFVITTSLLSNARVAPSIASAQIRRLRHHPSFPRPSFWQRSGPRKESKPFLSSLESAACRLLLRRGCHLHGHDVTPHQEEEGIRRVICRVCKITQTQLSRYSHTRNTSFGRALCYRDGFRRRGSVGSAVRRRT